MTVTETKTRPKLFCQLKGPGPAYRLPTLVGHEQHDPSKYRNPAYSLKKRFDTNAKTLGPGPAYDTQRLTRNGPEKMPAYTIGERHKSYAWRLGPGPCAYNVRLCPPMNHDLRPPAYTLKPRAPVKYETDVPGPNIYSLPTCIGPRIPDKRALGAYTIIGLHDEKLKSRGPGPAAYGNLRCDTVKRKYPSYSLKPPHKPNYITITPGPVHYSSFNTKKNAPKYSFGVRHSECSPPAFTPMDNI